MTEPTVPSRVTSFDPSGEGPVHAAEVTEAGGTRTIGDLATFVTSKNAGPFLLTLDVVFPDADTYRRVTRLGLLDRPTVARLYRIPERDVLDVTTW